MNWYKTARYGGAEKQRSIWYHGTKGRNLSSILSQGLIVEPKERAWPEDKGSHFNRPSRASLGGIYLTQNLGTAYSSAYKDLDKNENAVIVIMSIIPRSLVIDEDDIAYIVKDATGQNTTERLVAEAFLSKFYRKNIDEYRKKYVEDVLNSLDDKFFSALVDVKKMNPELKNRLERLLIDNWEIVLNRQMVYVPDMLGNFIWRGMFFRYLPPELEKEIRKKQKEIYETEEIINEKEKDELYDNVLLTYMPVIPEQQQAEREFGLFLNQLTKTLKPYVLSSGSYNRTARSLNNIGFSGSNKIIGVVEIIRNIKVKPGQLDKDYVKVVYGVLPDGFKEQWNKTIGELNIVASNNNWYKMAKNSIGDLTEDQFKAIYGEGWIIVDSSFIKAVRYSEIARIMDVKLIDGHTYNYFHIPKRIFTNFLKAKSKGEYFNRVIKENYGEK